MVPSPALDALLARVEALRDEVDAMRPLTREQAGRAMQRLRLEWTYHSNAIEGNSLTYGETRALLMHGVTAHGKPLKDHLDIRRHREVIEYLEAFVRSDEPLTLAVLREMHKQLMGDEYEVSAETPEGERVKRMVPGGEFKTLPNNVVTETGETHYYATPEETPALMTDLVDGLRQSGDAHPVVRAALFHHRFVEIHPFPDGNGRTARVLMNLLLMRSGYVPAVIRQERRPAYYGALAAADGGDRQPVVEFVAEELAETTELYLRALKGEPDPTAFDKRVALLRRTTDTAAAEAGRRTRDRVRLMGDRLVSPAGVLIDRGVRKLASVFDREVFDAEVTLSDGSSLTGLESWSALRRRSWRRAEATWKLHEHHLDTRASLLVTLVAYAGEDGVDFRSVVDGETAVEATYAYDPPPDEAEAERIAAETLERTLRVVEQITASAA